MLSRLAVLRGALAPRSLQVVSARFCSEKPLGPIVLEPVPLSDNWDPSDKYPGSPVNPERDLVNFPVPKIKDYPPPTRFYLFPYSWFEFFEPKTGVSGGYVFLGTFTTFLLSKELWVMEHDIYCGLSLFVIFSYANYKFGDQARAWMLKESDRRDGELLNFQRAQREILEHQVNDEKKSQWQMEGQKYLFEAKKDNVGLQLEAEFRERQMEVYNAVKRRIDYHTSVQEAESRLRHDHLVNWIVKEVKKGLTPDLEKAALKQCMADLKGLASRS